MISASSSWTTSSSRSTARATSSSCSVIPITPLLVACEQVIDRRRDRVTGTRGPSPARRRAFAIALVGTLLLAGCGDDDPEDPIGRFDALVEVGATCQTLFDVRNELDPKVAAVVEMNEGLREIGCFSSWSERSDLGE